MENYITLEDLKDFEVWKSWRNGGGLELEPPYAHILKIVEDAFDEHILADGWIDCGTPMASILGREDFIKEITDKLKK